MDAWSRPISTQSGPDCTLNALADACELVSGEGIDYSRKFLEQEARRQDTTLFSGQPFAGMSLRAAASALHRIGVCAEGLCPYDWAEGKQPDPAAYADAEKRIEWFELEQIRIDDVDAALARPNTVVVVSHGIDGKWTSATAESVLDNVWEGTAGHTTTITEKLLDGTYRDRNSWGPNWANRGTVQVTRALIEHGFDRWRVTYVGPIFRVSAP